MLWDLLWARKWSSKWWLKNSVCFLYLGMSLFMWRTSSDFKQSEGRQSLPIKTSLYPRGAICYHSWLFDRKISSYQSLLSLSFSEENLWYCYGESKAVPLLSVLSCFCLIQLYSSLAYLLFSKSGFLLVLDI